ncbi:hypothetical protein EFE42_01195 [Methanohalophilus sp. RSK]|uniref:carboxypeptidase-like regulatory domain-containing protein n=1 Tax=Methanohalophilus sp. RSK TaxID=2485783 RepID=UPI000F43B50D|nr:carboxypeptidase-like regulatory domain-containing protein [Methanohalophilus sp. RSK]RNI15883.1 hypothetical protein EFE42_01195 [Methanohalophilus sp. RSK]
MKRIVLLLILLTFCIPNASALPYTGLPDPTHLCNHPDDDTIMFVGDDPNTGQKAVYEFYTDTGNYAQKLTGADYKDISYSDGSLYFVLSDGSLYKTSDTQGILNFSYSGNDDDFLFLGSVSSNSVLSHSEDKSLYTIPRRWMDGRDLTRIQPPVYTAQTVTSIDAPSDLYPHPEGILIADYHMDTRDNRGVTGYVYLYNDTGKHTLLSKYRGGVYSQYSQAGYRVVGRDVAGNLYTVGGTGYSQYRYNLIGTMTYYQHPYNATTDTYGEVAIGSVTTPNDMTVADNVYICYDDTIESLATIDGLTGYTGEPIPPVSATVGWDVGEAGTYTAGDVATINYSITSMDSSKDYTIEVWTSSTMKQSYTISDSSGSVTYDFPIDAAPTAYLAAIYEGDTKLDAQHCYLENPNYDYAISFSKSNYEVGEWVVVNYEGLTSDMELVLLNDDALDDGDVLQNWTKSGDGQVSYKLPDDYSQDGINVLLIMDEVNIDQDYADVVTADEDLLYGVVYDSSTGQRISGASVTVNSKVSITSLDGNYQLTLPEGYYEATVSEGGYLATKQWVTVQGLTQQNFYLTPETADTDVYGVVRDKDTNDPINDVVIYVNGNSFGETSFTSSSGYFSLDGLTPGQEYDISATVSGYESYESSFTATNNSTDLSFSMYPAGTGGDTDDPTGDDFSIDWETPDDAKSFAQQWTGITWFILVVLFVVAAMGAKK